MMTLNEDREQWTAHVVAAQLGDPDAWPAIIDRFEDLAMALAVGLCGDLDEAPDIAQEAFVLAFRHIVALEEPSAFPAWLLRLVRTANSRRTRRRRFATVPFDATPGAAHNDGGRNTLVDPAEGPDDLVLAAIEAAQVRATVERLPEHERCVVALHHLAEMPYAEVAEFLGITVAAAKKRAWSARVRLRELFPMVSDAVAEAAVAGTLAVARPSNSHAFRDTILVFQSIRVRDADALARVLARDPTLATVTEDWSPEEGFALKLGFSERATALIRAAGTGDVRLVRLLVESGAPVDDPCMCADHESALVTAVNIGATDVVEYLLDRGASLDQSAFDGESTALHVAVHRNRHDLVTRLLAAGADPAKTDAHGRTAADWAAPKTGQRPEANDGDVLWTRIRSIDLFAPLRRGALVHIPPAYGLGAMRALFGMVNAFAPAQWWMIGFEHGPYEPAEFERETSESGTPATIDLIRPGHPSDRRRQFDETLQRLAMARGRKVVTCVPAPGHEHDVTLVLPTLAADQSVLATFVVATYSAERRSVPVALPEGFDARITFDHGRAKARLWPAIEPARTSSRTYPDTRHEDLANAARNLLSMYARSDPTFALPDPETLDDPRVGRQGQALLRYLTHSFRPFELLSATPAADTPIAEILNQVEEILGN